MVSFKIRATILRDERVFQIHNKWEFTFRTLNLDLEPGATTLSSRQTRQIKQSTLQTCAFCQNHSAFFNRLENWIWTLPLFTRWVHNFLVTDNDDSFELLRNSLSQIVIILCFSKTPNSSRNLPEMGKNFNFYFLSSRQYFCQILFQARGESTQ